MYFLSSSKQRDIYDETFSPLVESVLNGYNGKCGLKAIFFTHLKFFLF